MSQIWCHGATTAADTRDSASTNVNDALPKFREIVYSTVHSYVLFLTQASASSRYFFNLYFKAAYIKPNSNLPTLPYVWVLPWYWPAFASKSLPASRGSLNFRFLAGRSGS